MSIVSFPYNNPLPEKIICALCKQEIHIEDATIGPVITEGVISLVCNCHLWTDRKFIDEFADYTARERRKLFDSNGHNLTRHKAPHVRTIY
jgi:hypothetical protein